MLHVRGVGIIHSPGSICADIIPSTDKQEVSIGCGGVMLRTYLTKPSRGQEVRVWWAGILDLAAPGGLLASAAFQCVIRDGDNGDISAIGDLIHCLCRMRC